MNDSGHSQKMTSIDLSECSAADVVHALQKQGQFAALEPGYIAPHGSTRGCGRTEVVGVL